MLLIRKLFAGLILLPLVLAYGACKALRDGSLASKIRVQFYRFRGAKIGASVHLASGVSIRGAKNVVIGDRCFLGERVSIVAYGANVSIGDDCLIAADVSIISRSHIYKDLEVAIREQGYKYRPINIGSDVWFGYRAVVLPGAVIGDRCVIGAGVIVSGEIPPYTVSSGGIIKQRTSGS